MFLNCVRAHSIHTIIFVACVCIFLFSAQQGPTPKNIIDQMLSYLHGLLLANY
jgi:hypothetical protein